MAEYKIVKVDKRNKKIIKTEIETLSLPEQREFFYKKIEEYSRNRGWLGEDQELPLRFYKGLGLFIGNDKENLKIKYFVASEEEWW